MEKKDDRKNMRNRLLCAGQNCRKWRAGKSGGYEWRLDSRADGNCKKTSCREWDDFVYGGRGGEKSTCTVRHPGGGCGSDPGGNLFSGTVSALLCLHTRERFSMHGMWGTKRDSCRACGGIWSECGVQWIFVCASDCTGVHSGRNLQDSAGDRCGQYVTYGGLEWQKYLHFVRGRGRSCGASRIEGRSVCAGCAFGRRKRRCSDRMQPAQKKLGSSGWSKGSVHSDGRTKRI